MFLIYHELGMFLLFLKLLNYYIRKSLTSKFIILSLIYIMKGVCYVYCS